MEQGINAEQKDWTPRVLALGITLGFFLMLGILGFKEIPTGSKDMFNVMVGSLGTAWSGAVGYYFGSSKNAQHQNSLLAQSTLLPQAGRPQGGDATKAITFHSTSNTE